MALNLLKRIQTEFKGVDGGIEDTAEKQIPALIITRKVIVRRRGALAKTVN